MEKNICEMTYLSPIIDKSSMARVFDKSTFRRGKEFIHQTTRADRQSCFDFVYAHDACQQFKDWHSILDGLR